jgi:DNA-binding NarL/FixJ family response regulator
MSIRIIVADDHQIVRDGLCALLEKEKNFEVVCVCKNGRGAVKNAQKLNPDIIIMDISMPDLNGIEATRQITSSSNNTKVIALSIHSDKRFVTEMIKAGACGYLLKDCAFEELVQAIFAVSNNQIYLSSNITDVVIKDYVKRLSMDQSKEIDLLTTREREILQLVAEGLSTKDIASRLHISLKTVDAHRRNIMGKLDLHSIAELTKYAIREGLTSI